MKGTTIAFPTPLVAIGSILFHLVRAVYRTFVLR
jgi:hypothetical protein